MNGRSSSVTSDVIRLVILTRSVVISIVLWGLDLTVLLVLLIGLECFVAFSEAKSVS